MKRTEKKQKTDFFSLQNLNELSGIDGHIFFADKLIRKYGKQTSYDINSGLSAEEKGSIQDWDDIQYQLQAVYRKKRDEKLNISVIGEFSTGKSTFINALLRQELLASSALQGTTVASTVIEYSNVYEIEAEYVTGRQNKKVRYSKFEFLKKDLEGMTTEPSEAKKLKSVKVSLPSDILKNNFRIIDTPGTNVTEAWHEEVTVRTLNEISDLSIILISAEKPAPETMLRFVKKNLEIILPQCVFVVTKLDHVRQQERSRLLSYIKMKLETELEIREAVVLPFVSPAVLFHDTIADKEMESLLEMSLETEQRLIDHTVKQRTMALTKKLMVLTDSMYESISIQMEKIAKDYEIRLELLDRSKKSNLDVFVQKEKMYRLQSYDENTKGFLEDLEQKVYVRASNVRQVIFLNLYDKKNIDELKVYMSDDLSKDCVRLAEAMISEMNEYYTEIQNSFLFEMNTFKRSFKKLYQSLKIIPLDMTQSKYSMPPKPQIEMVNITASAQYVVQQLASENRAYFGGMAAGAAAGTAILPGIGTVLGGLAGLIGGAMAAPDIDKVREECKDKLNLQLVNYYNSVADKVISAADKYIAQIRSCLADEIDQYLKRYRNEIERQIALEKHQRSMINSQISDLNSDRRQIENHKKQLESVMVQLNNFGRKER